ncbi:MAG: peptidylprolyl isomerase [Lentimicrobiaceae bacterium]|nr:peptidylprolyl isomerase [Lentimicrobiaceae bacterium]
MKKLFLSICFITFLSIILAQNLDDILFKVGDEAITADLFVKTFNKNNSLETTTRSELRDYLDLYVNFKLKVKDGIDSKIDTASSFQRELTSYRNQSAQSYLVDKEVSEKLIKEAIERSKLMLRASHILIMCKEDASPKDSLAAFNKIMDIRKKITTGSITFPEAAVLYSEDPSAKDEAAPNGKIQYGNKGDLGYFTVFDLIYPFETVAYNTAVGNYSMPFRTQFGYHLIWVQDKQPVISKISISQILLMDSAAKTGNITPTVKEKLTRIEEALNSGEDFANLATQYTDDPASKEKGGKIDPFSPNRRPGDFIKQCLLLEKEQMSKPFSSVVGWHIIKLHELILPEIKEDEVRQNMVTRIQRDSRSSKSVESMVAKLKKEYNYTEKGKKAAFNLLTKKLETEPIMLSETELLTISGIDKLKPIATFANQTITIKDFIHYLNLFQGIDIKEQVKSFLDNQFKMYLKDKILKYEFDNLENKYPEYKELMTEYLHGIILFEMNNERVWSESLKDSEVLEAFYENNKNNYLDSEGNLKPFSEIRSTVLTDYQNELETEWLNRLKEKYPVWINEELFESLLKK